MPDVKTIVTAAVIALVIYVALENLPSVKKALTFTA